MGLVQAYENVRERGEVFTPPSIVKLTLDPEDYYLRDPNTVILEPAVGHGVYLLDVLKRRLPPPVGFLVLQTVSTLYGVDIDKSNCEHCRDNLYNLASKYLPDHCQDMLKILRDIVDSNIIHDNFLEPSMDSLISEWVITPTSIKRIDYVFATWVEYQEAAVPVSTFTYL